MTAGLATTFEKYPELAVFLVVGVGYWIGGLKVRKFGLGPMTGRSSPAQYLGTTSRCR